MFVKNDTETIPEIFQTSSGKSVGRLSWSHYAVLLQVKDEKARDWYEKEAIEQTWSVRGKYRSPFVDAGALL